MENELIDSEVVKSEANRSTGPVAIAGKAISSKNAMKHLRSKLQPVARRPACCCAPYTIILAHEIYRR